MNLDKLKRRWRYARFDRRSPLALPAAEDVEIDIVIPVTCKDLRILPLALEGVRRNVANRIKEIYLVAPAMEEIREFCREHSLTFVDERAVMGYGPRDIGLIAGNPPTDRSGWLYQQLLKLSGKIGTAPYFVTIDADHVLLRPHTFVSADGRHVLYRSREHHTPYYDNIRRLTGIAAGDGLSYVAHKMVFSRRRLADLRAEIERCNPGKSWDRAIIDSVDKAEISGFSEFELYGHYLADGEKCAMPFRNHHFRYSQLLPFDDLVRKYGRRYAAVTFPEYLNS